MFPTNAGYPDIRRVSTTFFTKKKILVSDSREYLRRNIPEGISGYSSDSVYAMRERIQMKEEIMDDTESRMAFLELEMCFVSIYSCEVKMGP